MVIVALGLSRGVVVITLLRLGEHSTVSEGRPAEVALVAHPGAVSLGAVLAVFGDANAIRAAILAAVLVRFAAAH